jgi:hypothetical protein
VLWTSGYNPLTGELFLFFLGLLGFVSVFYPSLQRQNLNAKNDRMSLARIWHVLKLPEFMDTEALTAACLSQPRLTLIPLREIMTPPCECAHHLLLRKPHSPAQLVGRLQLFLDKIGDLINRWKISTSPGRCGVSDELI